MLARIGHEPLIKRPVRDRSGRIVRIGYNYRFGAAGDLLRYIREIKLPVVFRPQRIQANRSAGHQRAERENRVARVGGEDQVVRPRERKTDMGDALLREPHTAMISSSASCTP